MKYRGHGFWACCLILASGMLFAACDDDKTNNDTDVMEDGTGSDTDTTACCTEAQCAASGQVCNTTSCVCEDPSATGCQSVGETCDPTEAQSASFVCADDGTGNGICFQSCDAATPCPSGAVCTGGSPSFCAESECTSFFSNDCPEAGTKCVPVGNNANFCFANGTVQAGGDCQAHSDCADTLICAGGTCEAPDCSPLTTEQECGSGQIYSGLSTSNGGTLNLGFCYDTCDPFGDGSECAEGEACSPTERNSSTGALEGVCLEGSSGTKAVGEACSQTELCVDGALCLSGVCRAICDPEFATSGSGACDGTDFCSGLTFNDGSEAPFGACLETCTPWGDDPIAAGCESGEWCQPATQLPEGVDSLGFCESEGNTAVGAACPATEAQAATLSDCAAGGICLLSSQPADGREGMTCSTDDECGGGTCFSGTCQAAAECFAICNPNATSVADPGGDVCTGQDACTPLATSDDAGETVFFDVGTCNASCDFDADVACEAEGETCIPGEFLIFGDIDLCIEDIPALDERESCDTAGLDQFDFCDTNSFCIDLSGIPALQSTAGSLCYQVCRFLTAAPATAVIGSVDNGYVTVTAAESGRAGNDWTIVTMPSTPGTAVAAATAIGSGDNGTVDIVADAAGVAGNTWTITTEAAVEAAASTTIGAGADGSVTIEANMAGSAGNAWSVTVVAGSEGTVLPSVTIDTDAITVTLAQVGGSTDIAANSATAIAAAINTASASNGNVVTATASGSGATAVTATVTDQAFTDGADGTLSASVDGTSITVKLAVDGGSIDSTSDANSATNVAAAINAAAGTDVTATASGDGSGLITGEVSGQSFTGGTDASTGALMVSVDGTTITVSLAVDGDGNIDATADGPNAAATIAAAINNATSDVTAEFSGDGTGAVSAAATVALIGGQDSKGPASKVHPDCNRPTAVCTADAFGVEAGFGICGIDECLNNNTVGCVENGDCCSQNCVDGTCMAQ